MTSPQSHRPEAAEGPGRSLPSDWIGPRSALRRFWHRGYPGEPSLLSSARSFSPAVGSRIEPDEVRGYYIDLRLKAWSAEWPPDWLISGGGQIYMGLAQWALGCYERHLCGDGEEWLAAARAAADYLLDEQEREGPSAGAWVHRFALEHTYHLEPPWISAMGQGEGASLLMRIHHETGEERYADGARRALAPLRAPVRAGGTKADLDGGFFLEEYPTDPPSFVLNGALFALWGCYDVAVGLADADAQALFQEGVGTLAANLHRFDTGYWSRYDLYPHPVMNIASPAYHLLHINQLKAMSLLSPEVELESTAKRFESYMASRARSARAWARKALFRVAVPRNRLLARRVPWRRRAGGGA